MLATAWRGVVGMALSPVVIDEDALLYVAPDELASVIEEACLDLGGNAVPVALDHTGNIGFQPAGAPEIPSADGPRQRFYVVG